MPNVGINVSQLMRVFELDGSPLSIDLEPRIMRRYELVSRRGVIRGNECSATAW